KNLTLSPISLLDAGRCALALNCTADLNASESCTYVVPRTGRCDQLCTGCPAECRIDDLNISGGIPSSCAGDDGDLIAECKSCPMGCKVSSEKIKALDEQAMAANSCGDCPLDHRLISPSLPIDYTTGSCSLGRSEEHT